MLQVCQYEHQLFDHFFPGEDPEGPSLAPLMDPLATILYDALRPHFIHLHALEELCEIVNILTHEASCLRSSQPLAPNLTTVLLSKASQLQRTRDETGSCRNRNKRVKQSVVLIMLFSLAPSWPDCTCMHHQKIVPKHAPHSASVIPFTHAFVIHHHEQWSPAESLLSKLLFFTQQPHTASYFIPGTVIVRVPTSNACFLVPDTHNGHVQVAEEQVGRRGVAVHPLRPVLHRTLADVQERLTFRAQAFIKVTVTVAPCLPHMQQSTVAFLCVYAWLGIYCFSGDDAVCKLCCNRAFVHFSQ